MIRRWRARRAEEQRRREAREHYMRLLDAFIAAGERYQDDWARGYDRSQGETGP